MDQYMLQLNTGRVNVFQTRLKDGWTPNRIARELGCAPNTVRSEFWAEASRNGQPASKIVRSSDTGRWTWSSGQKAVTMTHYLL